MGFLLFGLLGTAILGGLLFDLFDNNNQSQADDASPQDGTLPEDGTPPDAAGQYLVFDGTDPLTGTEGDDTLAAGQDDSLAPETITLLGGDDTAIIEQPFDIDVFGGDGNDVLTSTAAGNTLDGGAGNDTLSGIDATSMFGGAGEDHITFNSDVELNSSVARIDGGDGDDTINILADAGVNTADRGGAIVQGGSGADDFNIYLDLQNSQDNASLLNTSVVRITDFTPNEDSLLIEIERHADTADRDITIDLDQTLVDGTYSSLITLTFAATADASQATAEIRVISTGPFALANIQLAGV